MKQKKINTDLTLYFSRNFPVNKRSNRSKIYNVSLGIGGNIGDTIGLFESLLKRFKNDTRLIVKQTSPLLKNPPFGYLDQNDFINAIIEVSTDLPPLQLLKLMQKYELLFGRKRSFKDAPRTLDIDIIIIQKMKIDLKINNKNLIIPHKGWKDRDSVQIPLQWITKQKVKNGK